MAHVVLKGSSVMPVVGQLVAGGMAKHVRVDREWKFCGLSSPGELERRSVAGSFTQ